LRAFHDGQRRSAASFRDVGSARTTVRLALVLGAMLAVSTSMCAPATAGDPPKRTLPDYEGRPPPPATPGETLLWIPRVVFSPVYVTR
jgi:hypothetical protein